MPPRPITPLAERFWAKVDKDGPVPAHRPELGPCWIWTSTTNEHGYGLIHAGGKRSGPPIKAHRVSAQLAGMDIARRVVRHACDNPPCVNPAHLLTGTVADNVRDMHERGRGNIGAVNGQAKLTDDQVLAIRAKLAAGMQGKALAAEYNVGTPTISVIKNAKAWRHLATEPVAVPKSPRERTVSCACGCGAEFTTPDKWGNEREWLKGHSRRGRAA
jgi:hypothetical protein